MLDLRDVDLQDVCTALEDNSFTTSWWIDPGSGGVIVKSEELTWEELGIDDPDALVAIEPVLSGEAYGDMEDFIDVVADPRARDLLSRAIAGRGAFRRFKDTLLEFPQLREAWFAFHDACMRRRAIEWLCDMRLVAASEADEALARIETPLPPPGGGGPDVREIARAVAADLSQLYGDRLRDVRLYGSWARGDAQPDSDVDVLVVLDRVDSPWQERETMSDILWRHSFEHDVVIAALPVSQAELDAGREPVLIRAATESASVA